MKTNRLKQVRDNGNVPIGHMLSVFNVRDIALMMDTADIDFVIVDMEHNTFTIAQVADIIAWFKATTIAPIVRIPQIDHHFITRLMDAGVLGIMVPDIKSASSIEAIVQLMKYPPLGKRGPTIGIANTDFKSVDREAFMAFSNQNTLLIAQIESQKGLDHLDEIASTPGLDALWVGHNDLSQSLGITGQFYTDKFLHALSHIVTVGNQYGLSLGCQPRSLEQAQEWLAMGFNLISYSNDLNLYCLSLQQSVATLKQIIIKKDKT